MNTILSTAFNTTPQNNIPLANIQGHFDRGDNLAADRDSFKSNARQRRSIDENSLD
jgi:hypothetical protein